MHVVSSATKLVAGKAVACSIANGGLITFTDGKVTLAIAGCKKLLWHRIKMDIDKMQVLPRAKQGAFPYAPNTGNDGCKQGPQQHSQKKQKQKAKAKAKAEAAKR